MVLVWQTIEISRKNKEIQRLKRVRAFIVKPGGVCRPMVVQIPWSIEQRHPLSKIFFRRAETNQFVRLKLVVKLFFGKQAPVGRFDPEKSANSEDEPWIEKISLISYCRVIRFLYIHEPHKFTPA